MLCFRKNSSAPAPQSIGSFATCAILSARRSSSTAKQKGIITRKRAISRTDLPGLWFNASELHALLTVQHLLAEIQPGLLESHIAPLRERIERILKTKGTAQGDTTRRIRILRMAGRRCDPENGSSPHVRG